jgi:hypothetical protein
MKKNLVKTKGLLGGWMDGFGKILRQISNFKDCLHQFQTEILDYTKTKFLHKVTFSKSPISCEAR